MSFKNAIKTTINGAPHYRVAILKIHRDLLDMLIPKAAEGECYNCYLEKLGIYALHDALKLPENCRILDMSALAFAEEGIVIFRLTSIDFRATLEGCTIPDVLPVYVGENPNHRFSHWEPGAAVRGDKARESEGKL